MAQKKRDTFRGFRVPDEPYEVSVLPLPVIERAPASPPVEVEVIRERGTPGVLDSPWTAIEIWTRNRIYGVSSQLICMQVRDRTSGEVNPAHSALGARLIGGQRRDENGMIVEVSHPFPEPGSNAVFSTGVGSRLMVSETSPTWRVVMRQRVVHVSEEGKVPSWEDITGPTFTL